MPDITTGHTAEVTLTVPAESAYVSVLRTTAAGLAARLDFTVDDIEDLRIAVGEASALLLPARAAERQLHAVLRLAPEVLSVALTLTGGASTIDTDSFAWQVLTTLAHSCDVSGDDTSTTITLSVRSTLLD